MQYLYQIISIAGKNIVLPKNVLEGRKKNWKIYLNVKKTWKWSTNMFTWWWCFWCFNNALNVNECSRMLDVNRLFNEKSDLISIFRLRYDRFLRKVCANCDAFRLVDYLLLFAFIASFCLPLFWQKPNHQHTKAQIKKSAL